MPRARKRHEPEDDEDDVAMRTHATPGPSTTSISTTFSTEMQMDVTPTPTTLFNLNPLNQQQLDLPQHPSTATAASSTTSPPMPPARTSHGKKRDASYIPRPPNAFILFRSSFIRSQRVPGNVEGNHSTLSKIIGKCWKALPREERERWEREAVAAQAEHRKKYPDWRFRPGANAAAAAASAAAKSIKERVGSPVLKRRKVCGNEKDKSGGGVDDDAEWEPKKGRGKDRARGEVKGTKKDKGKERAKERAGTREKGKAKEKPREKLKEKGTEEDEERLAKIAALLVDGVKGRELEKALEQWEGGRRRKEGESSRRTTEQVRGEDDEMDELDPELNPDAEGLADPRSWRDSNSPSSGSISAPDTSTSTEFSKIPLTHWYKRDRSSPRPVSEATQQQPQQHTGAMAFSSSNAGNGMNGDEECQDSWWAPSSGFDTDASGLGYDPVHIASFGQGFHINRDEDEHEPSPPGSAVGWTQTAGGFITVVVDPFLTIDNCSIASDINEKHPEVSPHCISPTSVPVSVPIAVPPQVSTPCSGGLGPCSCPLPSMPSIPPIPFSVLPPSGHSPLSGAAGTNIGTTATDLAASAAPANSLGAQVPLSPLLYSEPRVANTQQPHPHPQPHPHHPQPHSLPRSHSQPHCQLRHPQHHHTRSFSSLADWDGAVSASPLPPSTFLPLSSHNSHQPHLSHTPLNSVPDPVAGLQPGGNEGKPSLYAIHESAYSLQYYGEPADWESSYG